MHEYTNVKNLDNDILRDGKTLSVEAMKGLTIDEIINLYGHGYVLEGTEGIIHQSLSNIESMQTYSQVCSGYPTPDINWSSVSQQGGHYLYKESAKAFKINPASRCLDSITFYAVRRIANVNVYVEIREDDGTGNKPLGIPGSSTGQLAQVPVPYGEIPTSFGSFTVDFGLLLPSVGTYWVVLRPIDYSCSNAATQRLELSRHSPGSRYMVYGYSELYCSPIGCCWYFLDTDVIPMATYKKTYSPQVLTTISIAPTDASINTGTTQQLTATCKDQNTNTMTCPTLTWLSSNTSVATVNSNGLVTGVSAGSTNITASGGGKTSNISTITVTVPGPTLTTISIAPTAASISIGTTQQLTATCKDQNTNTMTCPTLTWLSSNTSVATVNSNGLVTGVSVGSTNITASGGGKTSDVSAITVTAVPTLAIITISPASQSINIGGIVQLTRVCKDQNNNTITCPTLTWVSSNTSVATVSQTPPPGGLVIGVSAGTTNITANAAGVTSNISAITITGVVSVLTSIAISPTTATVSIGGTRQLIAVCKDQNDAIMICPTLTWESSNSSVVSVDQTGLVTGGSIGIANITARSGIVTSISTITVSEAPPPSAGAGGMLAIAAVAAIGLAYLVMRKPSSPP